MRLGQDPGDLSRLHDVVVPGPVPLWPPAPIWYVILALLLAGLGCAVFWQVRRWRRAAYRRQAAREVAALFASPPPALAALPALVKRAALAAFPREQVAALSGERWLQFLDATCAVSAAGRAFAQGPGRALLALSVEPGAAERLDEASRAQLRQCVLAWIRRHRPGRVSC